MVAAEPPAASAALGEDVHAAGEAVPEVGLAGARRQRWVGGPREQGWEARPRLLGRRRRPDSLVGLGFGLGGIWGSVVGLEEEVEREGDGVDGEHDDEDARDEAAKPLAVVVCSTASHLRRRAAGCGGGRRSVIGAVGMDSQTERPR